VKQRDALVAEALVTAEIDRLGGDLSFASFTVESIVKRYGLDWGKYDTTNGGQQDRARQLVRNAVSKAHHDWRIRPSNREGRYVVWRAV